VLKLILQIWALLVRGPVQLSWLAFASPAFSCLIVSNRGAIHILFWPFSGAHLHPFLDKAIINSLTFYSWPGCVYVPRCHLNSIYQSILQHDPARKLLFLPGYRHSRYYCCFLSDHHWKLPTPFASHEYVLLSSHEDRPRSKAIPRTGLYATRKLAAYDWYRRCYYSI
jgi:hypothetical protein